MNRAAVRGAILIGLLMLGLSASAQTPVLEKDSAAVPAKRWLLICCGLPGDEPHRERLTAACTKIIAAAEPKLGVTPDRLRVLAGDETMQSAIDGTASEVGICTRETVAEELQQLAPELEADDACWVLLLGHSHLYDTRSWFNVSGPDFDQTEFAQWTEPLACREQVMWLTMPISGFWIKPLARDSRVIISATEADLEFTGTEMPYALADVLAGDAAHQNLEDLDGDEAISLLDLYLATNLEVHGWFLANDRLQTEHAQLEDNGDGRGSELQEDYLPDPAEEEAAPSDAAPQPPKPIRSELLDGFRSRHILLTAP